MSKISPDRKHKEFIKIQAVQHLGRASPESLGRTPLIYKRLGVTLHRFKHPIRVKATDISNKTKLARVIRMNYGFGHFVLMFYDYHHHNKKFNPDFKCIGESCVHKQKNQCKIYKRHEQGWSCKHNARIRPSWTPRARILISPVSLELENDYTYKWYAEHDQMHCFSKWFWKGSGSIKESNKLTPLMNDITKPARHYKWF